MFNETKPPVIAEFLLKIFFNKENSIHRLGDFEEVFSKIIVENGRFSALKWYWLQVIKSVPGLFHHLIFWSTIMFNSYFKIALRNLKKHKGFSLLNITGLAIGIASTILIFLYVQFELSYDKYHKNSNSIYRVVQPTFMNTGSAVTAAPLAPLLEKELPEVISSVRIMRLISNSLKVNCFAQRVFIAKIFFHQFF